MQTSWPATRFATGIDRVCPLVKAACGVNKANTPLPLAGRRGGTHLSNMTHGLPSLLDRGDLGTVSAPRPSKKATCVAPDHSFGGKIGALPLFRRRAPTLFHVTRRHYHKNAVNPSHKAGLFRIMGTDVLTMPTPAAPFGSERVRPVRRNYREGGRLTAPAINPLCRDSG